MQTIMSIRLEGFLENDSPVVGVGEPSYLGGGFKHFLCSPLFGEMIHFDSYFSNGLKPPPRYHDPDRCVSGHSSSV